MSNAYFYYFNAFFMTIKQNSDKSEYSWGVIDFPFSIRTEYDCLSCLFENIQKYATNFFVGNI